MTDTKTHILNIAERHFAAHGFDGTSLRGIIKEADVNVAAVAYHFGNKEDLFAAVIDRFSKPVVDQQLARLRAELNRKEVSIESIVRAFYEPPLFLVKKLGADGESLSLLLGRCHSEPEPVYSMVDKHFAACRDEFINAFRKVIPGRSEALYQWHFEFMLSLIVTFLTRQKFVRQRYSTSKTWQVDEAAEMLVAFCIPALSTKK